VTFPDIETTTQPPVNLTRQKRQLAEQAIAQAADSHWADAAETNQKLLELGADAEAENRLAKALWEQGELGAAREHYQAALALDPTNRIAERNIDRLRTLLVAAGAQALHLFTTLFLGPRLTNATELYGALGIATTILFWFYLVGRLVLAGAMLNASLDDQRSGAEQA